MRRLEFWLNTLNQYTEGNAWDFTVEDSLALMGSHTLMDNLACTTDGAASARGAKKIGTQGCGGTKRMFQWTNAYFVDTTSGKCEPRNPSPGGHPPATTCFTGAMLGAHVAPHNCASSCIHVLCPACNTEPCIKPAAAKCQTCSLSQPVGASTVSRVCDTNTCP